MYRKTKSNKNEFFPGIKNISELSVFRGRWAIREFRQYRRRSSGLSPIVAEEYECIVDTNSSVLANVSWIFANISESSVGFRR